MDATKTPGPRPSFDDRRALLYQHYLGEKEQLLAEESVVGDIEPPRVRRRRVFLRHLKISCWVIAAFLLVVAIKHLSIAKRLWSTGPSKQTEINLDWPPNAPYMCDEKSSADYDFEFDHPGQFRFEEVFDWKYVHTRYVHSEIRLQTAAKDADKDVTAKITVTTNKKAVIEALSYDKSDSELVFKVAIPDGTQNLCLNIEADVYIKPGIKLSTLGIFSNVASLNILPGLDAIEIDETIIHVDVGSISATPLKSRKTRIETGTSSVEGTFDLLDLLSINTASGRVALDVIPKEASKSDPEPAKLIIGTLSGAINIACPPFGVEIPERDYESFISSLSGSISGNYIHGSITKITSRSGAIDAKLLPYAAAEHHSVITTHTATGRQDIQLLEPYTDKGKAITLLGGDHFSTTGALNIKYPDEWEGTIEGSTKAGSLTLTGKDVQVIASGGYGPVGAWVEAVKGNGEAKLRFGSQTGKLDVEIGGI